jgi:hypothetical protein
VSRIGTVSELILERSMQSTSMSWRRRFSRWLIPLLLCPVAGAHARAPVDLPSWNDGAAKARIVAFVNAAIEPGGRDFVPPAERIAVFDNDGTL